MAPFFYFLTSEVFIRNRINQQVLEQLIRGQVNVPRSLAIYLARKLSGWKLSEIGAEFGLEKYSSVNSIVFRTKQMISQNKQL